MVKKKVKRKNLTSRFFNCILICKLNKRLYSFFLKCLTSENINKLFSVKSIEALSKDKSLVKILLTQLNSETCSICQEIKPKGLTANTKAWIYGFAASTIITLTSFSGAFLIPLTKNKYYKRVLMFLISVGIGTLTGTAFLHLIPQVK